MNIALIADDGKKELMVQFCIAYCGILAKHDVYDWAAHLRSHRPEGPHLPALGAGLPAARCAHQL